MVDVDLENGDTEDEVRHHVTHRTQVAVVGTGLVVSAASR